MQQDFSVAGQNNASWSLVRNNNGRITQKTETVDGVTSNYNYSYDSMGRLLTVTKDNVLVEEYQYDATGTRIYEMNTQRGISGRTLDYSDEDHLLSAGSTAYEYNLDGFLTTKTEGTNVTSYDYSSRGELLGVNLSDGTLIEYIHDPLGRRIAKKVGGTIVEKYLWQGLTRLLAVYDGSDNLLMRFEYADSRMPVAMTAAGVTYYLGFDHVGSLRLVADAAGIVVKSITYDSFGNIIDDTNPALKVPFGFAGGLHDRDTGLIRFGYRDYDPDIGRWTAKDPIGFVGGDTDLYGYVLNDPINLIDPYGNKFTVGSTASLLMFDYSWDTSNPSNANLSFTPGQLYGGSVNFGWQSDKETIVEPLMFNIGFSKFLGISFAADFSKFTLNLGWGRSLPIKGSAPIEGDYSFGGWLYDKLHYDESPDIQRLKIQQQGSPCI